VRDVCFFWASFSTRAVPTHELCRYFFSRFCVLQSPGIEGFSHLRSISSSIFDLSSYFDGRRCEATFMRPPVLVGTAVFHCPHLMNFQSGSSAPDFLGSSGVVESELA